MTSKRPTRLQQFTSIGIFLLPLIAGSFAGLGLLQGQDRLRDLDAELSAQAALIDAAERKLAVGHGGPGSVVPIGLSAPTLPLAGAQLQERVSDILAGAGASIASFEIVSDMAEEKPDRVAVRIAFGADITALQAALFELETAQPQMQVAALDVAVRSDSDTDLDVALEVESRWEVEP